MRIYLANLIMVGEAMVFVVLFNEIRAFGYVVGLEPRFWVLYSEMGIFLTIIAFGVYNLRGALPGKKEQFEIPGSTRDKIAASCEIRGRGNAEASREQWETDFALWGLYEF